MLEIEECFDYSDVSEVTNKIIFERSIKYEEILGKILTNFYQDLEKPVKQEILGLLFNIPNQILTLFLDNFSSTLDEFKVELAKIAEEVPGLKNHINRFISLIMCSQIAYVYDFTSSWFSIEDVKDNIFDYKVKSSNEELQKIISYGKLDDLQKFFEASASYVKNSADAVKR